ncbi:MAG: MBL fold metallo-hydrolase [Burkholderiales bacterium]
MRFCSLGSGSAGNAWVIESRRSSAASRVLVDCGFSLRELDMRLARVGLASEEIAAIFVTHEHGDHIGSALALSRRRRIPLWMSRGTWRALDEPALPDDLLHFARDGETIAIGELELRPFTVPHDAQEPLQLSCSDGARRLGILTDVGSCTAHLLAQLERCDALAIECNHDRDMLARSRYPASLRARIGGSHGHLANDAAAQILAACHHAALRHIVAAHLSAENNTPQIAAAALASACGAAEDDIIVATPRNGAPWLALG